MHGVLLGDRLNPKRRRFGRVRAFTTLSFALGRVPLWLVTKPRSQRAKAMERRFFRQIARGFGIEIAVEGQPATSALYVSNHISWADIPILASLLDADFIAKSEVGRWPIIGPLARRFGTILIERDKKIRIGDQADAIHAHLRAGRSAILFPEGTTSDGTAILPFRTSLFAAANSANTVQPVVIRYLDPAGTPLTPARQREIAWIDDDALVGGAAKVARARTRALVQFLPPLDPRAFKDRKAFAEAARLAMAAAYAAAPNLPR